MRAESAWYQVGAMSQTIRILPALLAFATATNAPAQFHRIFSNPTESQRIEITPLVFDPRRVRDHTLACTCFAACEG